MSPRRTDDEATDHAPHFDRLERLLRLEADAERQRFAEQARGNSKASLVVTADDAGPGGRLLVTLARKDRTAVRLPRAVQAGAPVFLNAVLEGDEAVALRGLVVRRNETSLVVAVSEPADGLPDATAWRVDLAPDEVTRQRQSAALRRARDARRDRLAELRDVLMGTREPAFTATATPAQTFDADLNPTQREAVELALSAADLAVIHGPPGTGKTTAVVEVVRRMVGRGERVLVCAPSNAAVDHLLERLLAAGQQPVRLGHPNRVAPALVGRTLDALAEEHPDSKQARKMTREAFQLLRKAGKWTRAAPPPGTRQSMRQEARALLADARKLERQAEERILDAARVVCATLTGLDPDVLGERVFDAAVIDEAGQATEPACWAAVARAGRVVLAGDHCQLPPTVLHPQAVVGGLGVSLMERVVALWGGPAARMLAVQYRMHAYIMAFPSSEFYNGRLEAPDSVAERRLLDLDGVMSSEWTDAVVTYFDTAGAGYDEEPEPNGSSRRNPQEAKLAVRVVREMVEAGVSPSGVAVVSPYSAQVRLLRETLNNPAVEVDSVDGFQGREKDVIVYSAVRSNAAGEVGFLADTRRTNVALTRARRRLIVIGDSATLGQHPFYARMLEHFEKAGAYRSVWELGD